MPPKKRVILPNKNKSSVSDVKSPKRVTTLVKRLATKRKAKIQTTRKKRLSKRNSNANDKDDDSTQFNGDYNVDESENLQNPLRIPTTDINDDDEDDYGSEEAEAEEFPMWDTNEFQIWDTGEVLANTCGTSLEAARNIVHLIETDNTFPFIARYRKPLIDYMSPERLQEVFNSYDDICKLKKKALTILHTLKKSDKLTTSMHDSIIAARSIDELDLLYEPFKNKRAKTLAERAYELKLEEPIKSILKGEHFSISSLCNSEMKTPSDVQQHLIHGVADMIHKDPEVLKTIRKLKTSTMATIECSKARAKKTNTILNNKISKYENKQNTNDKYDLYLNFKMRSDLIKPHQILAINRGEAKKVLSVKTIISQVFFDEFLRFCMKKWSHELIKEAAVDAYKRFIQPWLVRKVRSEMTTRAIKLSVDLFCSNLKRLLLTAPIKNCNIVGIDPGFSGGCKVAIINSAGKPMETFVLHPNFNKTAVVDSQAATLSYFIEEHKCKVIALGDGTGCRETENWLRNINEIKDVSIIIVPEQGVSIYSCSPDAAKEFPLMDPKQISAISLARRAQDPLSELIKVKPKNIGVGMYQHDIPSKLLTDALDNVIVNCVSFVGVDLNTSSQTLLSKIAGLSENKAKNIIKYREDNGKFKNREDLLNVTGIGSKTYKQCVGFLRVPNSKIKYDNTWIHPEQYDLANRFLREIDEEMINIGRNSFIERVKKKVINMGIRTLIETLEADSSYFELIFDALVQPPLVDPLRNIKPVFSMTVVAEDDLVEGATLTGVVRNVTSFGIFVDCGVGRNGLIHISKIGNSKHPQLGDKVSVMIIPELTPTRLPLKLLQIL